MSGGTSRSADTAKVQAWIARLKPTQEIAYDYWPQPDGSDPDDGMWTLMSLDQRRVLDTVAYDDVSHGLIGDLLDEAATAGQVTKVACGYYRHPQRAEEDRKQSELMTRYHAASAPLDALYWSTAS